VDIINNKYNATSNPTCALPVGDRIHDRLPEVLGMPEGIFVVFLGLLRVALALLLYLPRLVLSAEYHAPSLQAMWREEGREWGTRRRRRRADMRVCVLGVGVGVATQSHCQKWPRPTLARCCSLCALWMFALCSAFSARLPIIDSRCTRRLCRRASASSLSWFTSSARSLLMWAVFNARSSSKASFATRAFRSCR